MFGCGTVGGGVYNLIQNKQKQFCKMGLDIQITKICVRDPLRKRNFEYNGNVTEMVSNVNEILDDPEINCIMELIGGVDLAKEITFKAIKKGKHVLTANKALIATHMKELLHALSENENVKLGYEAAVCGGIPIIHTLQDTYLADNVVKIVGIMNGTTNYMLSKMDKEQVNYDDVLKEAQDLGFAEANPSADVDGYDVQAKIAILAKLGFHGTVLPDQVPTMGIARITQADFAYAKMMQSTIKLLGVATKVDPQNDKKIAVYVSPVMVPQTNVIANVNGATNLVNIISDNLESSSFVGQGAGRYPTANSVLSDVIQLAKGLMPMPFAPDEPVELQTDYSSRFYVRIKISDQLGVIRTIGELAEKADVSIYAILQLPITDKNNVDFVVTTDTTKLSNVQNMCQTIAKQSFVLEEPLHFPILD